MSTQRKYRLMFGGHGTAAGPVKAGDFVMLTREQADHFNGDPELPQRFVECVEGQPPPEFPPKPKTTSGASWGTVLGR